WRFGKVTRLAEMRVDLPAFGRPTSATSARSLSSSARSSWSPFVPGSARLGARFVEVAKRAFPARGYEERLPLLDEVADDLPGLTVLHDRSDRHRNRKSRPVLPVAVVP